MTSEHCPKADEWEQGLNMLQSMVPRNSQEELIDYLVNLIRAALAQRVMRLDPTNANDVQFNRSHAVFRPP